MDNLNIHIEYLNYLKDTFIQSKAYFPTMNNDVIGKSNISTGLFYQNLGYNIHFQFDHNLNSKDIVKFNFISNWLNQNFIIRIYAYLDYHKFVNKIDQKINGWESVDLIRRLRHYFAHRGGKFNNKDADEIKTVEMICQKYNLNQNNFKDDFPIPIDKVILPLLDDVLKYIKKRLSIK